MQEDHTASIYPRRQAKPVLHLLDLPTEIKLKILREVEPRMLFHLDLACRDLHGILSDPYTWCEVVSRLLERPYLELPFSKLEARGLVEVVTASRHKKKCDVPTCKRDGGYVYFADRQCFCQEHYNSETCGSVQILRGHMLDIMGRRRAGGRGVYPRRLTNDLVKIIKRVFPLFEGAGTHQARWSILAIRKLWKDVNFHWDSLGRKDRFGVREHLSDLHISCASGCTDKEAHMLFQSLFDEYEIKGKEAVERVEVVHELSLAANPKADASIFQARKEAGKQARREAFQQRLEDLGHPASHVTEVLDPYLAHSSRYGRLTNREFRLRLQELRPLLAHCKERHAAEYRTVRVKIVAHAVMDYHRMNFPDTRKALAGIAGYLITTPQRVSAQ